MVQGDTSMALAMKPIEDDTSKAIMSQAVMKPVPEIIIKLSRDQSIDLLLESVAKFTDKVTVVIVG